MTMHIKLNLNDAPMVRGFKDFNTANKTAVRNTLSQAAGMSRKDGVAKIKQDFTLRNDFTVRSVVYDKATQTEIRDMAATVGALRRAYYMEQQELGGTRKHGKRGDKILNTGLPMKPTREGESPARPVSTLYYVQKIKRQMVSRGGFKRQGLSPAARSVAQMYVGWKNNLYVKRNLDIFRVDTFERRGRDSIRARMTHLYSIHLQPIRVTKHQWLEPSVKRASSNLANMYIWQLKKQWKSGPEKL